MQKLALVVLLWGQLRMYSWQVDYIRVTGTRAKAQRDPTRDCPSGREISTQNELSEFSLSGLVAAAGFPQPGPRVHTWRHSQHEPNKD